MLKGFNLAIIVTMTLSVLALAAQGEQADRKEENTGQVIAYLIEEVKSSHLVFIRNGENHSSEEAAKHIRRKYERFKSRIESPEDFIRLCASRSLVSGKPYLVVTPQGIITLESWLGQILREYRSRRIPEHGPPPRSWPK